MKLKHFFYLPIAIISTVAVTSCLDDDNGGNTDIRPGFISFINAMPDTAALDFYVGDTQDPLGGSSIPYTERFPDESYIDVTPYRYNLFVAYPDETTTAIFESPFDVNQDIYHSIYIYYTPEDVKGIILADDLESPASGKAKVRFIHLGTDAPDVDLGVTGETDAWFSGYEFEEASEDYIEVDAGLYELEVREAGTMNVLFTALDVQLEDSKVYTLWIKGINEETGAKALGLESIEHIEVEPTTP